MSAPTPTILATSGGFLPGDRTLLRPGPLLDYALELSRPGPLPRVCFIGTAGGDDPFWAAACHESYYGRDVLVSSLKLFTKPNIADVAEHLGRQDVIWVTGGSTANLLAVWRVHEMGEILRRCWENGVVLGGVSAGSLCWHTGGTTDSFGPDLQLITGALGFLPWSNCPHYDGEDQRRPLFQRLVGDGELPAGYATDNGVGLHYQGTEMVEAVSEVEGRAAYLVERTGPGQVCETKLDPRLLPGAVPA